MSDTDLTMGEWCTAMYAKMQLALAALGMEVSEEDEEPCEPPDCA